MSLITRLRSVIRTFKNKALGELWLSSKTSKIDVKMHGRILLRLDRLNTVNAPEELNLPGFNFQALRGKPLRYSVHVNGPWCLTFEFYGGDAWRVDYEQYH
jgi:proteic killer suppression protein